MKTVLLMLALLASSSLKAQPPSTQRNPVFPGWYADPEAAIFGKRYWIYPTYSAKYNEQVFFDAFSSKDLVTWTRHARILDTASIKWARRAMWAPAAIEKDGKYFLFFSANDIQNDSERGGIGVAVADKPEGPFRDYLGQPLVDRFHNGAQPIDQFVFHDGSNYYLIYGGWRHCNIARLKPDFTGFLPFDDGTTFREITPANYVEGPIMFKRKASLRQAQGKLGTSATRYYFMWSEGGWTGPDYSVAYAVSDSPFGPFERVGKILQEDSKVATGAGHHSVINVPGTDEWFIVYHRRPLDQTDRNARVVCIDKMSFDERGLILPVVITNEGVKSRSIQ